MRETRNCQGTLRKRLCSRHICGPSPYFFMRLLLTVWCLSSKHTSLKTTREMQQSPVPKTIKEPSLCESKRGWFSSRANIKSHGVLEQQLRRAAPSDVLRRHTRRRSVEAVVEPANGHQRRGCTSSHDNHDGETEVHPYRDNLVKFGNRKKIRLGTVLAFMVRRRNKESDNRKGALA